MVASGTDWRKNGMKWPSELDCWSLVAATQLQVQMNFRFLMSPNTLFNKFTKESNVISVIIL